MDDIGQGAAGSADEVLAALRALAEQDIQRRPVDGGWNAWEIAYHLLDMERWYVAKLCEAASATEREALDRFVAVWERLRAEALALARAIPAGRLDQDGLLTGVPGWTPRALLAAMVAHDREHLAQLAAALRGTGGQSMPDGPVLHITTAVAWQAAQVAGIYRAESLQDEGFIHCSTPAQAAETANRYFAGQRGLVLLVIDPARLRPALVYEPATGGESFPHLYGPLNLEAVQAVLPLAPGMDGRFSLPPEAATLTPESRDAATG